jgi:hypothetical protein
MRHTTVHPRCSLILPFLLLSVACADEPAARSATVVRDSAGVRIVENRAPSWGDGEAWSVRLAPLADIGGGDTEDDQLFGVGGAVRLSDGRIVIANGTQELWYYDGQGGLLTKAGGRGAGPGEFRGIGQLIRLPGDTLLVRDRWRRTWFDPQGRYLRDASFDAGSFAADPALLTHGGTAFAVNVRDQTGPPQMGLSTLTRTWVLLGTEGEAADTVGSFPAGQIFTIRDGGGLVPYPRPFSRPGYAPSMGATGMFLGRAEAFEVAVYSYKGDLVEIIRGRHTPTPVTSEHIAAFRQRFLERFPPQSQGTVERWLAEVPYPEVLPALGRLMVDERQNLWAQDFAPDGSTSASWNVFDASGLWLGGVDLPDNLEPREIGADYVLGVWRDEDDVEHVRMYELIKP